MGTLMVLGVLIGMGTAASGDEVIVQEGTLPGAKMEQTLTYSPNRQVFDQTVNKTVEQLKTGNYEYFQSPGNEPTVTVETKVTVGFGVKSFGVGKGRVLRETRGASHEAFNRFTGRGGGGGGGKLSVTLKPSLE